MKIRDRQNRLAKIAKCLDARKALPADDLGFLVDALRRIAAGEDANQALDVVAKLARECYGDVGDVNRAFTFSVRDIQQRGKGQTWIKEGGAKAITAALQNLEKWLWIEIDGDNWQLCTCRLSMRW